MTTKTPVALCTVLCVALLWSSVPAAQGPPELTADQLHAWRLHDQYVGVIKQLDEMENRRRGLLGDVRHDAQAGPGAMGQVVDAAREMALLNQRIADATKQATELEAAWDRKFYGRFGFLKDARETIVDSVTKTKMDKIEFRLRNFAFAPDKPQPEPVPPPAKPVPAPPSTVKPAPATPGRPGGVPTSGYWRLLETRTLRYVLRAGTTGSVDVSDGSISGTETATNDEGPATWAGACTWSVQAPGGLNRLVPGEVIETSMTVTDRSVPEKVSGWNHGYTGVGGSIRFDMPNLSLTASHGAATDLVNLSARWGKTETQKGSWTVPKGPGSSEWGGKAALNANCTFGRLERVYEWTTEPYDAGKAPPAPSPGPPQPSFSGLWTGSWTNSVGEKQKDSLLVEEKPDGTITGTWSGNIPVTGRRVNATTLELRGHTSTRDYQVTATLEGGALTMDYVARRLDATGSYRGTSTLTRER